MSLRADRVEQAPERDEAQAEPDQQRQPIVNTPPGIGPTEPARCVDPAGVASDTGFGAMQQVDALEAEVHRERDDDRLDAQADDEQAAERADGEPEAEDDRDRDRAAEPVRARARRRTRCW